MAEPSNVKALAEGPPLERLVRRLVELPADFRRSPLVGGVGAIDVAAVANDLVIGLGGRRLQDGQARLLSADATGARAIRRASNRRSLALAACWLLADPWFVAAGLADEVAVVLAEGLDRFADAVPVDLLLTDDDRREELVRVVLAALGLRPAGESAAQSADRLAALDTVAREVVLTETRKAEQRAAEVRRRLEEQRLADEAARMNRE